MARKVFNMQGGYHSAAALSAFLTAAFAGDVAAGLNVTETGSTGMNVLVQPGTGKIDTGQGFARVIQIDSAETVTLSPASPSNARKDFIVAYIDNAVTPTTSVIDNINDILMLTSVTGTTVDPTGSMIQAAVGAGNPYIILARVNVPQSALSLTNSNIDDLRSLALITKSSQLSNGIIGLPQMKDTGWIDVPNIGSYTPNIKARRVAGVVHLQGYAQSASPFGTGWEDVATLPVGLQPSVYWEGTGAKAHQVRIQTNGNIGIARGAGSSQLIIYLGSISYI